MVQRLRKRFALKSKKEEQLNHEAIERAVLSWEAPEYIKHKKGKLWFAIAGIAVILLVLYGIKTNSLSTSIVFIVLAGVYFLAHTHEPRTLKIIISEMGIKVGNKYYPYSQIKAFWINYHPPFVKTLNFRTLERMYKEEIIQLSGQDPVPVRTYLARQIPEWEGKEETLTDLFARILKI